MLVFLLDFGAERFVEVKYGYKNAHPNVEGAVTSGGEAQQHTHSHGDAGVVTDDVVQTDPVNESSGIYKVNLEKADDHDKAERSFHQQIAAFLILEFGVMFHSVIIGLNLGTAGAEFATLYPVLVFHQFL